MDVGPVLPAGGQAPVAVVQPAEEPLDHPPDPAQPRAVPDPAAGQHRPDPTSTQRRTVGAGVIGAVTGDLIGSPLGRRRGRPGRPRTGGTPSTRLMSWVLS
jgi:hypothetical protein